MIDTGSLPSLNQGDQDMAKKKEEVQAEPEKTEKDTPSKSDMMREAMAEDIVETGAIKDWISKRYGVQLSTAQVSQFKSTEKARQAKKSGEQPTERKPRKPRTPKAETFVPPTSNGDKLSAAEMRAIIEIAERVGAEKVRSLLELLD